MADTPTIEPAVFNAGDTLRFDRTLSNYPASAGWTLRYTLINATSKITFNAAAAGDVHAVTVAATTTAVWAPGNYDWRARVDKAGEVYTVGEGRIVIRNAFSTATADARTHARRTLDAIESVIEGRASSAVAEYQIAGRQLKNIPIAELLTLRDRYRAEVAREDAASAAAQGLPDRRRVYVRFA
jgi:hypothetical protein